MLKVVGAGKIRMESPQKHLYKGDYAELLEYMELNGLKQITVELMESKTLNYNDMLDKATARGWL